MAHDWHYANSSYCKKLQILHHHKAPDTINPTINISKTSSQQHYPVNKDLEHLTYIM